jgi:hypothetical protein
MIATAAFTWRGRRVAAGERLELSAVDAAIVKYRHQATFAPAASSSGAPEAPRRRYKRRDLEAEE